MKFQEIIRSAMKSTGTTQKRLAEKLGYKSGPSAISVPLTRDDIYAGTLVRMLNAMGYEVVVRKDGEEFTLTNAPAVAER